MCCLVFKFSFLQFEQNFITCAPFLYQCIKTTLFIVRYSFWCWTMQKTFLFLKILFLYMYHSPTFPHFHPKILTVGWQRLAARLLRPSQNTRKWVKNEKCIVRYFESLFSLFAFRTRVGIHAKNQRNLRFIFLRQ